MSAQTEQRASGPDRRTFAAPPSTAGASWMMTIGALGAALGVGLAVLPKFLPEAASIAAMAASHGVSAGLVFGIGSLFVATGGALRSLARSAAHEREQAAARPDELQPQLEQLETDLAQVRGTLQELRVEFVYVKDSVLHLRQAVGDVLTTANPESMQEAVFRMATSLDQLGARLDERLTAQNETMQRAMQTFHDALLAACSRVDEVAERATQLANQIEGPVQASPLGLLDHFDDAGHVRAAAGHANGSRDPHGDLPRGPLPSLPMHDPQLATKMAHLQALMTDVRVQHVLSEMQRGSPMR